MTDIIILSNVDWNFNFQRHQALSILFSKNDFRVFYFNPYKTLAGKFKIPGISKLSNNIYKIDFFPLFPFENRNRYIKFLNRIIFSKFVEAFSILVSKKNAILYQFLPRGIKINNHNFSKIISDYIDRLPENFCNLNEQNSYDVEIYNSSELQICTDSNIVLSPKTVVIKNGIFFDKYEGCYKYNMFKWKKRYIIKNIAYIGGTHEVDFKFIDIISKQNPDKNFFIIGTIDKEIPKLSKNVNLLGYIPHNQVISYLKNIDLGIVPFLKNMVTQTVDAIKIYEFFACGIPVISSNYSNSLPSLVKKYTQYSEFSDLIREITTENERLSLSKELNEYAKSRDWRNLFADVISVLKN